MRSIQQSRHHFTGWTRAEATDHAFSRIGGHINRRAGLRAYSPKDIYQRGILRHNGEFAVTKGDLRGHGRHLFQREWDQRPDWSRGRNWLRLGYTLMRGMVLTGWGGVCNPEAERTGCQQSEPEYCPQARHQKPSHLPSPILPSQTSTSKL